MDNAIIMFVALAVIYFDFSILRKQDGALFRQVFSFPLWLAGIYPLIGLGVALALGHQEYFSVFFFVFIFPIYLLRRRRFRKALYQKEQTAGYVVAIPSSLTLVSDAIGLLWVWFLGMVGIVFVVVVIKELDPYIFSELGEIMTIAVASLSLLIFLIYRTVQCYPGLSFNEAIALKKGDQSWHKIVTIPAILGFGIAAITSFMVVSREVQPSTPLGDVLEASNASS